MVELEHESNWKKGARKVWSSRYSCCCIGSAVLLFCEGRYVMLGGMAAAQWVARLCPTEEG